ncbi:hypothetical protein HDU88_007845 [Geranomyces variabilis]|nr:hypothetical protein HDU88_007845 [Geranomyces variabilis]
MLSAEEFEFDTLINKLTAAFTTLRASYNTCKSAGPAAVSAKGQLLLSLEALQHGIDELTTLIAPKDSITLMTGRFIETKALVAAVDLGVAEALGGTKMSIAELAIAVEADQGKLRQIMSLLANRCVFSQHGDVFSNNAVSTLLRQDDPMSMKSLVGHWGIDTYRAALSLPEGLLTKNALKSPWELQVGESFYKWVHEPDNAASSTRVNNAMQSFNGSIQSDLVNGFDWSSLGIAATLVDVGGGTGAIDLALLKQWPNLRVELQDLPDVIEQAQIEWKKFHPDLCSRVTFTAQDFFQPQVRTHKHYLIKQCLHNWGDDDCLRILGNLRKSISPDGRLYAAEFVMTTDANAIKHIIDVNMLALVNSLQRTEDQFVELFEKAGFRVVTVHQSTGAISLIEAVPL